MKFDEIAYWNQNSYGKAVRVEKKWLKLAAVVVCIVTPFTNWLIPFLGKIITQDLVFRF